MKNICAVVLLFSGFAAALTFGGTKKITVEDSLAIHRAAAPKFSPDGNWILYTETEWDRKNDRQISHIYVARASQSASAGAQTATAFTSVKLTNGEKGETSPQWSPDGSRIAFLADRTTGD